MTDQQLDPNEALTEERKEQTVTIEDSGPARKKITVEIPEARIQATLEENFGKLKEEAALPGFRPGRAPQRLLQKRFGQAVRDEVRGQLLSESYQQAIDENSLDVIGEPDIEGLEDIKLPDSGSLTYVAEVEVAPEVTLPVLKHIEIKKPKIDVGKPAIDKEIKQLAQRYGAVATVTDGEVGIGDYVQAEVHIYAGENTTDESEEIARHPVTYIVMREGEDARGHVAGIIVDDLRDQLLSKKIGDTLTISMTGPTNHEDDRIKGKPITMTIRVDRIDRVEPASTEKLVEALGMESEDNLRERVTQVLETRRDREVQLAMHKQVSDYLVEQVDLTLPEGLTGRQVERSLRRLRMELSYRGMEEDEIAEKVAEARSENEDNARRELKLFFIVDAAAKSLEIDVEDDELNANISMMAQQHGRRPEKLRQAMARNGELEYLYLQIREQKTLDRIIEDAKIVEVDAPLESDKPADQGADETPSA